MKAAGQRKALIRRIVNLFQFIWPTSSKIRLLSCQDGSCRRVLAGNDIVNRVRRPSLFRPRHNTSRLADRQLCSIQHSPALSGYSVSRPIRAGEVETN